jgi:hypothetical protein
LLNKLAAKACYGTESFKILEGGAEHLTSLIDKLRLSGGVVEEEVADEMGAADKNLMNPPSSAKKGRPAAKEKRRKPGVELRQEESQKKSKKRAQNACSKCRETGHIRRKCPIEALKRKEKADREERLRLETELTL